MRANRVEAATMRRVRTPRLALKIKHISQNKQQTKWCFSETKYSHQAWAYAWKIFRRVRRPRLLDRSVTSASYTDTHSQLLENCLDCATARFRTKSVCITTSIHFHIKHFEMLFVIAFYDFIHKTSKEFRYVRSSRKAISFVLLRFYMSFNSYRLWFEPSAIICRSFYFSKFIWFFQFSH